MAFMPDCKIVTTDFIDARYYPLNTIVHVIKPLNMANFASDENKTNWKPHDH